MGKKKVDKVVKWNSCWVTSYPPHDFFFFFISHPFSADRFMWADRCEQVIACKSISLPTKEEMCVELNHKKNTIDLFIYPFFSFFSLIPPYACSCSFSLPSPVIIFLSTFNLARWCEKGKHCTMRTSVSKWGTLQVEQISCLFNAQLHLVYIKDARR